MVPGLAFGTTVPQPSDQPLRACLADLKRTFTDPALLHCQYDSNDAGIHQVASIVATDRSGEVWARLMTELMVP